MPWIYHNLMDQPSLIHDEVFEFGIIEELFQ